jgi:hypothetical protein
MNGGRNAATIETKMMLFLFDGVSSGQFPVECYFKKGGVQ